MVGFYILKVTIRTHLQFIGGSIITYDNALFVHLQGTDSPHLHHRAFNGMIKGACFVMPVDNNHYLFCIKHSTYTDRKSRLRHLIHIIFKKTGVGNDSISSQRLLAGAR